MPKINVAPQELISKANQLQQLNQRFFASVHQLESLEGALNRMWDGEANDSFHRAFQSDKVQMTNFYNAIQQYVQKLKEIAARYQQAEAINTDTAKTRTYN